MDKIKAEKQLKEKTEKYVREAILEAKRSEDRSVIKFGGKKIAMKKILIAVSSVAACAIVAVAGYSLYNMPINYVSLDINPSVELGVNVFNKVISTQSYNEDGALLLQDNHYQYLSVEKALLALLNEAKEQGYIAQDGSTVIAVTAESNNERTAAKLQDRCEDGLNLALKEGETSAVVYSDCMNLQLRTQAQENGLSPGKYRLLQILQELDPSVDIEQYRNAKITDIINEVNRLIEASPNKAVLAEEFAGALERIQGAAQQVASARGNTEQEQNGEQNQSQGSGSGQQEQNRNSDQNQSQSQSLSSGQNQQNMTGEQNQNQGTESQIQEQNQYQQSNSSSCSGSGSQSSAQSQSASTSGATQSGKPR